MLQALTRLSSVDLMVNTENNNDQKSGNDNEREELSSQLPSTTRSVIFINVPNGPIGLDLEGVNTDKSPTSACGGLLVAGLHARNEFQVNDIITACNGVSLTDLTVPEAVNVVASSGLDGIRQVVVLRHTYHTNSTSSGPTPSTNNGINSTMRSFHHPPAYPFNDQKPGVSFSHDLFQYPDWSPYLPSSFKRDYVVQKKLSTYSRYVNNSKKRAADRATFGYFLGVD